MATGIDANLTSTTNFLVKMLPIAMIVSVLFITIAIIGRIKEEHTKDSPEETQKKISDNITIISKKKSKKTCPCGSGKDFSSCCGS